MFFRPCLGILLLLVLTSSPLLGQEGQRLRYQFKEGDNLQYVLEQKMKMTMTVNGMDIETKMDMVMQLSWKVLGVDKDGNGQLRLSVTHAKMSMEGVTGNLQVDSTDAKEPDDAIGKIMHQAIKAIGTMEMTGTMLPTGDMKDVKVSEATIKALKNIPGAGQAGDSFSPETFKSMMAGVVLSPDPVKKGKTWTNTIEAKTAFGKTATENTYTYEGTIEQNKVKLDKISVKPKLTIEPNADAPAKIEIKAAKGAGTILFDNKTGRIAETTTQQTTQMTVTVNGMEIGQTVEQNTTLRLKKK